MNIKSIYYNDIDKLNIESMSNLSREDIIENYDYLIDYNLSWKADEFVNINYSNAGFIGYSNCNKLQCVFYNVS